MVGGLEIGGGFGKIGRSFGGLGADGTVEKEGRFGVVGSLGVVGGLGVEGDLGVEGNFGVECCGARVVRGDSKWFPLALEVIKPSVEGGPV